MARLESAYQIINDVALEVGLEPAADPYSSTDQAFAQLRGLLKTCGRELVTMYDWQILQKQFTLTTQAGDTGTYNLPIDFNRFINQTGWNRTSNMPVPGPMSPQTWAMMTGRDFGSTTLYASFMLSQNQMVLYPAPPPEGIEINFLYLSRNWVMESGGETNDTPDNGDDIILFDPILIVKFLKVKYLSAKGFDISVASREFDMCYMSITGYDKGAEILSASGNRGFPYLNGNNVPFTGFGN